MEALVVLASQYTVKETIDRLVILLQRWDMLIYARINRQIEAKWFGLSTRELEFILFDDPRLSVPIIELDPTLALCFPMRIIAWEEASGACRVAFKDPIVLMRIHVPDRDELFWPDLHADITRVLSQ